MGQHVGKPSVIATDGENDHIGRRVDPTREKLDRCRRELRLAGDVRTVSVQEPNVAGAGSSACEGDRCRGNAGRGEARRKGERVRPGRASTAIVRSVRALHVGRQARSGGIRVADGNNADRCADGARRRTKSKGGGQEEAGVHALKPTRESAPNWHIRHHRRFSLLDYTKRGWWFGVAPGMIAVNALATSPSDRARRGAETVVKRVLLHPDGSLRTRRVVATGLVLGVFAFFGTFLLFATSRVSSNGTIRMLWVIGAVFIIKLPLASLLWWLIARNREWPGQKVRWSPDETQEILAYISAQADRAATLPDAAPRLAHLSKEAWNAADNLDGEARVDALTVALHIDELAARERTHRGG